MNKVYLLLTATLVALTVNTTLAQVNSLGSETQVNTMTTNRQSMPAAAMDANKNYVIVWQSLNQVSATSDYDLYFQLFNNDGSPNGSETLLPVSTTDHGQSYPDVDMAADGRFVVCWISDEQNSDSLNVYRRIYNADGTAIQSRIRMSSSASGNQRFPRVATSPDFNTIGVWEEERLDGNDWGVYYRRFTSAGANLSASTLVNTTTAGPQHFPDVAVDDDENFVIVWQGLNGDGNYDIYAQRYTLPSTTHPGQTAGSEMTINTTTSGNQIHPRVAMDLDGNFMVTWTSEGQDGDGGGIYAAIFNSSGTEIVSEFKVNATSAGYQDFADVSSLKAGSFLVSWNSFGQDGDRYGVYANIYNGGGQTINPADQLINTTTDLYQQHPSIAAFYNTDSAVIAWQSGARRLATTQDGSDYGIYHQRAEALAPQVIAICKDITVQLDAGGQGSYLPSDLDNGSTSTNAPITFAASPTTFDCADLGPNTISLSVSDALNNVSTCSATITVEDVTPPSAVCQDITLTLNASGSAFITAANIDGGSSDECGSVTLAASIMAFSCNEVGSNLVVLTATDGSNNDNNCNATVTVEDNVSPTAICQPFTVQLDANGNGSLTANDIDNGSNDACGIASRIAGTTSFSCNEVGSNNVSLTITDNNGNTDACTASVTVEDNITPTAICQNHTVNLNTAGSGSLTTTDIDGGSADACGLGTLSLSTNTFGCNDIGDNTVTLTVPDVNGNSASCTATVSVVDNIAPTALCQSLFVYLNGGGNTTITSGDVDNGSNDACGISNYNLAPTSFTCNEIGNNTVTLTLTDNNSNISSCTANVAVQDSTSPAVFCQDITVFLDASGNASITGADLDSGSNDACDFASISPSLSSFTCNEIGANTVSLTVTDNEGNFSVCNSTVTVNDTVSPTAVCQSITAYLDANGNLSIAGSNIDGGSNDACGVANTTASPSAFTCANVGSNSSILTVTDNHGNVSTCTATVHVQDNISPVALCQNLFVYLNGAGNASITAGDLDGGSNDACGIASSVGSPLSFSCSDIGANSVSLTLTDNNGNASSCTSSVTVQDSVSPNAICQDITVDLDINGEVIIAASEVDNGSNDACGIATRIVSPNSFDCTATSGSNSVTLTITDVNGNAKSCASNVTVEDNTAPTAICQDITVYVDGNGDASILPSDVDNGSSDNCGTPNLAVSQNTFNCNQVSTSPNTVTLTVTDPQNHITTCTAGVSVLDTVPPVLICQDITLSLDANGTASGNSLINGALVSRSDNCQLSTITRTGPNIYSCSHVATGLQNIRLRQFDVNGNITDCFYDVSIEDHVPPTAICQDLTVQLDANGAASIVPSEIDNGSSDICGVADLSVSPQTFTCNNTGGNVVTLQVTDVNANVSTCTSLVTIEDTIPTVTVCQNITVDLDASGNASIVGSDLDAGSTDPCGIATLAASANTFNCSTVGSNTVTLTITDNNNNVSTCTSNVEVEDNVNPTAICQDITIELDATGSISIAPSEVDNGSNDACGIASLAVSPNTFDCDDIASSPNTVTLSLTDNNGNQSTCTAGVSVEDNVNPTALCQDITIDLDATGNASILPSDVNNGSNDACGIAMLDVAPNSFICNDIATNPNTVTLTVTDNNSNQSTCTAGLRVEDNVNPTALCQDITIDLDVAGNASILPSDIDNASNDACGIANMTVSPNTFDCNSISSSPNTVSLTVTDNNGNQSTCTAGLSVEDNVNPVARCQNLTISLNASGNASISPNQIDDNSSDACGIASLAISPNTFDCDDVVTSPNTVTLTVTDNNSNHSTCTAGVSVEDNVNPTAICQDITIDLDATGNASIVSSDIDNGSSDACGIASLAVSPNTFTCKDIASSPNTVSLTVIDNNGNSSACTAGLSVEDNVNPTALCQDITIDLDANGNASIAPSDVDNNSSDACGIANLNVSPSTFSCNQVTSTPNTVTLTVIDNNANQSACTAGVSVEDNVNPIALCQDITIDLDATGNASILPSDVNNGSNDVCGIAMLDVAPNTFNCNDIASNPNTVTLTVTDNNGNQSACTAGVRVEDNVNPTAICQDITIDLDASGNASIVSSDIDNGSNDACGIANLSISPNTFDCNTIGNNPNTVSLTVTDNNGNQSSCTAGVRVEDNVNPIAICQDITIDLDAAGNASIVPGQVDNNSNDACGIASLAVSPNTFDCDDVPSSPNTVTLIVIDNNNNTSTCTAGVRVEDNINPTALCQDITIDLDATGNASILPSDVDNNSNDACGIANLTVAPNTFDCSDVSTSPITVALTVTDIYSNQSTCTAGLSVEDNVIPTAICQDITVYLDANGNTSIVASDVDNGSSDACSIASLSVSPNTFDCATLGLNTVQLTATDVNGNSDNCNSGVTVIDPIAPTASCQNITVFLNSIGEYFMAPSEVDNGSSDACPITLSVNPSSFGCDEVGDNTVTLTVTDNGGNSSQCTATVTVDNSAARPPMLAQQSCNNCGIIRIFYCQFDPAPADLNDFIDGTVALNSAYGAGNPLFWFEDDNGALGLPYNGTGQEPASPNMSLAARTYFYWVSQVNPISGCLSIPIRVRVRVRKTPTIVFTPPPTPYCEGAQFNLADRVDDPNNVADIFDFYDDDPNSGGNLIGSVTATNGAVDPGQVIVATPVVGNNTYWVVATNTGGNNSITCPATASMSFVVSPKPVLSPVSDISVCPGDPVQVLFSSTPSAGAIFVWTNSNTQIGLGVSGFNNINFTATANNSGMDEVANLAVRAIVNGCASDIETFDITLHADPIIDMGINGTVCSGQVTGLPLNTAVGSPAASSYELVSVTLDPGLVAHNNNQSPGTGLSTNALSGDIFTNTTASSLTATYHLRAVSLNNCTSAIQSLVITILPEPVVTAGLKDTVCSGQAANLALSTTNGLPGTSFTWAPQSLPVGISLVSSTSPGTVITDILTNTTAAPIDVIYDVTATVGNCASIVVPCTIRVVSFPTVPPTASIDACEDPATPGQAIFDLTSLDATIGGGLAVNYFTDPNLLSPITGAGAYLSGSTTVYASVLNPTAPCPNRTDVTLTVTTLALPQLSSTAFPCDNQSQVINPAPVIGITFNFYDNDPDQRGVLLGSGSSYDPMLSAGQSQTIWVTATDGNCESNAVSTTVTVLVAPMPRINSNLNNGSICEGDKLELYGSGGGSYSWTGPNGFSSTQQNVVIPGFVLADTGEYILTVSNGVCSRPDTLYVEGNRISDPGQNGMLTIAANAQPVDLFNYLLGNPSRGGVWSGPSAPYAGDLGRFNPNFMYSGVYTYTLTNPGACKDSVVFATVTVNVTPVTAAKVRAKVYLEGVLDTTNLLMMDSLRITKFMPIFEPYTQLGYAHVNGGGNESFDVEQLDSAGVDALVDWVYLELRSANDNSHIVATRSALLQRDGDIVDLDGISPVCFNRVSPGFYYVVVGHRNHLSVMTGIPVFLNNVGTVSLDFRSGVLATYGTNPQNIVATTLISSGVQVMIGGDADFNGQIQNEDDVNHWIPFVGGAGYLRADYDCNSQVQNNERVYIWFRNVGKGTQVPVRSN
jgi:hypothetical protein